MIRWHNYLFNIWALKICPKTQNFAQVNSNFDKCLKKPSKLPKTFKIVPKWQNFANSGHLTDELHSKTEALFWRNYLSKFNDPKRSFKSDFVRVCGDGDDNFDTSSYSSFLRRPSSFYTAAESTTTSFTIERNIFRI